MSEIEGIRPAGVSGGFGIVEPVGEPCDDCGERPGVPHGCIMDDGLHRHGMTHVLDGKQTPLRWLCDDCYRHACDQELSRLDVMRGHCRAEGTDEPAWLHEAIARIQTRRPQPRN